MNKLLEFIHHNKHYVFYANNFSIKKNTGIDFDDYQITDETGSIITDFGENWTGKWSGDAVIVSVLSSYINGSIKVLHVCDDLKAIKNSYSKDTINIDGQNYIKKAFTDGLDLELQMVTKDGSTFYSNGDSFLLLDEDRNLITDYEHLYFNEFIEAFESKSFIWIDPTIKKELEVKHEP